MKVGLPASARLLAKGSLVAQHSAGPSLACPTLQGPGGMTSTRDLFVRMAGCRPCLYIW